MITKGIIRQLYSKEHKYYRVYIPLLRKPNDLEIDATYDAMRVCISGIYDDLNVNDVVYLGFEDDEYDKPVILGKLYTDKENQFITTNMMLRSLNVSEKSILSSNTLIGDIHVESLTRKVNSLTDLDSNNIIFINTLKYKPKFYINLGYMNLYSLLSNNTSNVRLKIKLKWVDTVGRHAMGTNSIGYFDINNNKYGLGGGVTSVNSPSTVNFDEVELQWKYISGSSTSISTYLQLYVNGKYEGQRNKSLPKDNDNLDDFYIFRLNYSDPLACDCEIENIQLYDDTKLIKDLKPIKNTETLNEGFKDIITDDIYYLINY